MPPESTGKPAYEAILRALGAYLDQEGTNRFRLIEVPDGFTVVIEVGEGRPNLQELHFSAADLIEQGDRMIRGRRLLGSKPHSVWRLGPSGRQDTFRALGFELDRAQAHGIVADELEDGLLVSYSYVDPSQGYQWRKRLIVLNADDIAAIVQRAQSRRQKRGLLRR